MKIEELSEQAANLTTDTLKKAKETAEKAKETAEVYVTKGIRRTRELKWYLFKFALRLLVFLFVLVVHISDRTLLERLMTQDIRNGINFVHIIWAVFMVIMCTHLIPNNRLTMAWQKARESAYVPVEEYNELELLRHVQKMNLGAWKVMLVWLCFNAIFAVLYLVGILRAGDLLLLSVFYFLCDYICILFFCPFQTKLMKNKCCVNCRIYDWGHFMMFTPMLFIKNFFSWSLFFTSLVVLINWEIKYARHPERFWEGSNKTLKCLNCKEQTCMVKRKLNGTEQSQLKLLMNNIYNKLN